jgi:choice-of-anchor B domain-containing protein
MKIRSTLLILLLLLSHWAASQTAKNIALVAHVPYPDLSSDVVGYVKNGVEYAILAHSTATAIISLANPSNPVVLQEIACGHPGDWHEVDVYQHYAYVTNEQGDGLRIIDLSNLPGPVTHVDTVIDNVISGHTLMIEDSTLYVFGSAPLFGANVYSLHEPMHPVVIGQYGNNFVHDAYVRNRIAYMCEPNAGTMSMVDMSNPASPVVLGSVPTTSQFPHNSWLNDAGTVCFTTDEVNSAYITAYDITNPANMEELGRYRGSLSGGVSIPHNVKVLNDFGVTAYYTDGVNIADFHRPHNMVEVGYFDTNPASGGGFEGNWGLDCYLPSGLILAADMSTGFWVLQPTYVQACYLEGQVTDVSNGNPITNATVHVAAPAITDQTNNLGNYALGTADPATVSVTYSKYGYRDTTLTVNLTNGNVIIQNVALQPNPLVGMIVTVKDATNGNPIPNAALLFEEVVSGIGQTFTANANGQVIDNSFMAAQYHLIAGHWGYLSQSIDTTIAAATNNIEVFLTPGYYDDFTFDFGWQTSGTATDGNWERGEPYGVVHTINTGPIWTNPEEDVTTDFSNECFVTGNSVTNYSFDGDVDAGVTILTSPPMDLSNDLNPWLIFDYWFLSTDQVGVHGFRDSLAIYIDNGNQTTRVWFVKDALYPFWQRDTVQIASFLPLTSTMRLIVRASDRLLDNAVEAALDEVRIEDQSTVGVHADKTMGYIAAVPNPSEGRLALHYDLHGQVNGQICLVNLEGKVMRRCELSAPAGIVQIEGALPAGMYFATLNGGDGRAASIKIVVQ